MSVVKSKSEQLAPMVQLIASRVIAWFRHEKQPLENEGEQYWADAVLLWQRIVMDTITNSIRVVFIFMIELLRGAKVKNNQAV